MPDPLIVYQPVFYLFIAVTILLTLGYSWGKRRNRKIFLSAFNALVDTVNPKDQNFINIGGLTGYHANIIPKRGEIIKKVEATLTLLPRQSWLYYPFSLLIRRYDRLFISLSFTQTKQDSLKEGHLIEQKYSRFRGPKISNEDKMQKEEFRWGNLDFLLYYEDQSVKTQLKKLIDKLPLPGTIRHIALVPEKKRIFIFMIPKYKTVGEYFSPVYKWILKL